MSKLHSDLTGSELHLPKGFAEASNSTVLSKDAFGNLEWVTKNDVGGSQGPQGIQGPAYSLANVKTVQLSPQVGQYNLVSDALAAITDASASNPYYINLAPGVYTETSTIVCKPYVIIRGAGKASKIVFNFSGAHGIRGADYGAIENCLLSFNNMTNANYALVYHENISSGAATRNFVVKNVHMGWSYYGIFCKATSYATQINLFDITYGGEYSCHYMFKLEGPSTATARIIGESIRPTSVSVQRPYALIHASGNVEGVFSGLLANSGGNALSGHTYGPTDPWVGTPSPATLGKYGVFIENGATVRLLNGTLRGWEKAIFSNNSGSAPTLHCTNVFVDRNIESVRIEHPSTQGALFIQGEEEKIYVDPSVTNLTLLVTDITSGDQGIINLGKLKVGPSIDTTFDLNYLNRFESTAGVYSGGVLSVNSGRILDITSGKGYFENAGVWTEVMWDAQQITIDANSERYVYIDSTGTAQQTASLNDSSSAIYLGRAVTTASAVLILDVSPIQGAHGINKLYDFMRGTFGAVYESGSTVSENGSVAYNLDIGSGSYWYLNKNFEPSGGTQATFNQISRNGSGGWNISTLTTVNSTQYDDGSGTLQALGAGQFGCRYLYGVGEGANEKYFLQIGQATHASLAAAQAESIPTPPSYFVDGVVPIARIIVKSGDAAIAPNGEITSIKPTLGGASTAGGAAASDHGSLTGLNDIGDHPGYLDLAATRTMAGNLNMGGFQITNVGNVDGVNVSDHFSRHLPNGSDPISSGVASSINATNATGTANAFARQDHTHKVIVPSLSSEVSLQDHLAAFHSAGVVFTSDAAISDAGGGAVDVSAGTFYVRGSASASATLYAYSFPGTTGLALTDASLNYIYVSYNGGTPNITATTVESTDYYSKALVGTVYRDGTSLHIASKERALIGDHAGAMSRFNRSTMPYARMHNGMGGGALTGTGTRNIAISQYNYWHGLEEGSIAAKDTNTGDTFTYWYNRSSWTSVATQTQISNSQYDNAGTLTSLTSNYYCPHFVYLESDGHINVIYGAGQYSTVGQAIAEAPPINLPTLFSHHAVYIGKIIIQQGASSFADVLSAFTNRTEDYVITSHTELSNIGTNTHAQIDTAISNSVSHIANTSNPHNTTIAQISPLTTKGDLMAYSTATSRLPIGTDNQMLLADSTQTFGMKWGHPYLTVSSAGSAVATSTTSATYVQIDSMTLTPAAGTYFYLFTSSGNVTATGGDGEYITYVGGSAVASSRRAMNTNAGAAASNYDSAMNIAGFATVNGSQSIAIYYRINSGTFNVNERTLLLVRVY